MLPEIDERDVPLVILSACLNTNPTKRREVIKEYKTHKPCTVMTRNMF